MIENLDDKNPSNNYGDTPLHCATWIPGSFEVFEIIFEHVEDKNPSNNCGSTPLFYAAANGYLEICKLIIDNVEDKNPATFAHCKKLPFFHEIVP